MDFYLIWAPCDDERLADRLLEAVQAKGIQAELHGNGSGQPDSGYSIRFLSEDLKLFDTKIEIVKDICYSVSVVHHNKRWHALANKL